MTDGFRKDTFTYDIVAYIGTLSVRKGADDTEWAREINIVSWNGHPAKVDIREWNKSHTRMSKGITLTDDEAKRMYELLKENNFHLKTGFVGTPYLCRVLSENGYNDVAYTLLMNDDYPSWLYEVKMGATTIWERWNSVLPNGKISGIEMNSMNHYAYGSIEEWIYRNAAGIQPSEEEPGFRKICLKPQPDYRLQWIDAKVNTTLGLLRSYWKIEDPTHLRVEFTVPFGAKATVVLPDACAEELKDGFTQCGNDAVKEVGPGSYCWTYQLTREYRKSFTLDSYTKELFANEEARQAILEVLPGIERMPFASEMATLRDMLDNPFMRVADEDQQRLAEKLKTIKA